MNVDFLVFPTYTQKTKMTGLFSIKAISIDFMRFRECLSVACPFSMGGRFYK